MQTLVAATVFGNEPVEMPIGSSAMYIWTEKIPPKASLFCLDKNPFVFLSPPPFYFCACRLVAKISNFPYLKVFLAEVHEDFLPLFLNARINVLKAVLPRVQVGMQCQVSTSWLPPVRDSWLAIGLERGSPLYIKRRGP